jgi:hypothetical protein
MRARFKVRNEHQAEAKKVAVILIELWIGRKDLLERSPKLSFSRFEVRLSKAVSMRLSRKASLIERMRELIPHTPDHLDRVLYIAIDEAQTIGYLNLG